MVCKVKKNVHLRHHFVFNQGPKATKAADIFSGDFYQRGIDKNCGNLVANLIFYRALMTSTTNVSILGTIFFEKLIALNIHPHEVAPALHSLVS